MSTATRTAVVASRVGLHARPASLFVQAAAATGLPVTIAVGSGDPVDARSILMVMGLGARHGDRVVLSAEGEGAEEALATLAGLVETDHDA
ncbi:phosphocarrier protein [Kineococcus radiotolerans]|uniref:Phosphocarrier protein HPr n=2 Tax=Kineococcus radiotolerans TaxID=131568 RepID=A6W886_KINRD|nr:HPr family phosphocarrier protein [Kineococcus radiotolerans]ABS03025.1 Phosphotransferase system, phosphocarrier protein HPr [Kineococcus radiotolerans SRS30216 = ATCC BAA-149]MBB2899769.1 phosphocarrier protein [Kineococcus radiotolerans]